MNANLQITNKKTQAVPFQPLDENQEHFTGSEIITADEILDQARYIIAKRMERGASFFDVEAAKEYALIHCADHEREYFSVLFLDAKHRLIAHDFIFTGTVHGSAVYPREIVKEALRRNAVAVILAHNHPSGDPEPSQADLAITKRIREALDLMDINVLDHVIVGSESVVSLAQRGNLSG